MKAKDDSVEKAAGYRSVLVPRKGDRRYPLAEIIKEGKRSVIEKIVEHDAKG